MTKPRIDRSAPDAEIAVPAADAPMPTIENEPPCLFVPGAGITTADVFEITLMFLLQLTGSPASVEKGALRALVLPPNRVAELSDSARRFMSPTSNSIN